MFMVLVAIVVATSTSFVASADSSRGLLLKKPLTESEKTITNSRCARKIVLPETNETACLMQKRKARAA
jgi:hypothetical protein